MTVTAINSVERRQALSDPLDKFRRMLEIRAFEDGVVDLFAEGAVHGTTHTCQGQEALAVGLASALRTDDVVSCTYRGHGIALALGMSPDVVLGEIMGRTTGCIGGMAGSMHLCAPEVGLLPTFAIVGAGIPIGVGSALAFQVRDEPKVAVAVFGDGATNIGAFHEGLNLAAVWHLPIVFVCDNNLYGEYSRYDLTTPIRDLALRADSYAIPHQVVDGMDLGMVKEAVGAAVERARGGAGPFFIEAKTYRFAGHSRSDQAKYRPVGELDEWRKRDPIAAYEQVLLSTGSATGEDLKRARDEITNEIANVIARTRAAPEPQPSAMFDHVWTDTVGASS